MLRSLLLLALATKALTKAAKVRKLQPARATPTIAARQTSCTATTTTTSPWNMEGTTYTVTSGQAITVDQNDVPANAVASGPCATVSAGAGATAILSYGGVASLFGVPGQAASVQITGIGTIAYATNGYCNEIQELESVSLQTMLSGTIVFGGFGAPFQITADTISQSASIELNNPQIAVITSLLDGASFYITPATTSINSVTVSYVTSATIDAEGSGASLTILNGLNARITAGTGADVSLSGTSDSFTVSPSATLTANEVSANGTVSPGGTAYVTGSGNVVTYTGFGSIGGLGATATVVSGAVTIASSANAVASSLATLCVHGDAAQVMMSAGATATMLLGAIVTAASTPLVSLVPGPGATIVQIGPPGFQGRRRQVNTLGTYSAAPANTSGGMRRRAQMPMQTQNVCGHGMTYCPMEGMGSYSCVDTQTDIFSCSSTNSGDDCTSLSDGEVQCVQGVCMVVVEEVDE